MTSAYLASRPPAIAEHPLLHVAPRAVTVLHTQLSLSHPRTFTHTVPLCGTLRTLCIPGEVLHIIYIELKASSPHHNFPSYMVLGSR